MTHKDPEIGKLGIDLVEEMYRITHSFPKEDASSRSRLYASLRSEAAP